MGTGHGQLGRISDIALGVRDREGTAGVEDQGPLSSSRKRFTPGFQEFSEAMTQFRQE